MVKKTALEEYSRPRSGGIIGISLDEGDTLIDVVLTQPGDEVVLSTRNGMAIRFDEAQARAMGRNTRGVKGITLQEDDEVVGMVVADPEGYLLTVCENGYGKRTPFGANIAGEAPAEADEVEETVEEPSSEPEAEAAELVADDAIKERSGMRYRKQRRGGKGVRDIRTSERNGPVVGIESVRDDDDIMLITAQAWSTARTSAKFASSAATRRACASWISTKATKSPRSPRWPRRTTNHRQKAPKYPRAPSRKVPSPLARRQRSRIKVVRSCGV